MKTPPSTTVANAKVKRKTFKSFRGLQRKGGKKQKQQYHFECLSTVGRNRLVKIKWHGKFFLLSGKCSVHKSQRNSNELQTILTDTTLKKWFVPDIIFNIQRALLNLPKELTRCHFRSHFATFWWEPIWGVGGPQMLSRHFSILVTIMSTTFHNFLEWKWNLPSYITANKLFFQKNPQYVGSLYGKSVFL